MLKGLSRWMKLLFVASLALNFIVIGVFAGHRLGLWHGGHHHGLRHHILKIMPEDKREQVDQILKAHREKYPFRKRRFRANWPKYEAALREQNFDRAAFLKLFEQDAEQHSTRIVDSGTAIADIAELLSPQERVEVLDKIKKHWKHRRRFRHRHHDQRH